MTTKTGDWSASVDVLGQFFYILIVLAIVILLFLICSRWFASIRGASRGNNIRVIDSCGVAPQCSVQLLQAGERTFLIGVTKEHISILGEITGQALNTPSKPNLRVFEQYFKKYTSEAQNDRKEDEHDG